MAELFKCLLLLTVGLTLLIISSDVFVDAASSLAIRLKVPKMLIALTIASFGTCAPELAISFQSISSGNAEMTLANVIGSCIVNILLIIGIASIVKPIRVKRTTIKKELPILVFVTSAFVLLLSDSIFLGKKGGLNRMDAVMLLLWFAFFMFYIISVVKNEKKERRSKAKYSLEKSILYLVISMLVIILASDLVVDNAVLLAESIGISQKIIAMTVIVIGTSLPELTMTVASARKGEFDMAVGNIIGTNIFNIGVVLGLPTLIYGGYTSDSFNLIDTVVVLLSSIMFYVFGKSDRKLTRREGVLMLSVFVIYYIYLFLH